MVSTHLKNISQLGWLLAIYGKIKNVPNHQLVFPSSVGIITFHPPVTSSIVGICWDKLTIPRKMGGKHGIVLPTLEENAGCLKLSQYSQISWNARWWCESLFTMQMLSHFQTSMKHRLPRTPLQTPNERGLPPLKRQIVYLKMYFQVSAGLYAQMVLYPKATTVKLATQALVLLEPQCWYSMS